MNARFGHHLLILRHAHSSWARPGERDHQRPLDERGRADAARLAQIVADEELTIDAVVCSTATRAVDTFAALKAQLGEAVAIAYSDDLYALGTEAYFAAARASQDAKTVLIVGHNPTIEEFTRSLAGSGEEEARAAVATGFPTCALAIVGLEQPFSQIEPGAGHLIRVIRP